MDSISDVVVAVLRLAVWLVVLALVFIPLERLFGRRDMPMGDKQSPFVQVKFFLSSSLAPGFLLSVPLALVAVLVEKVVPANLTTWGASLAVWQQLALATGIAEIGGYWGHRLCHSNSLLWRIHAVHHSSTRMTWLVHTHAHPLDIVIVRLFSLAPLYILGLAKPTLSGSGIATIVAIVTVFWGFFIHSNVRWRFGWLEKVFSTPAFHHWHHSSNHPLNRNFSAMFPLVDILFGTYHLPNTWPSGYGCEQKAEFGYYKQLVSPFVPLVRHHLSEVEEDS